MTVGRKQSTQRRPQASKRERHMIGLVTPWHEAGIDTLESYSRTVAKDREGWR